MPDPVVRGMGGGLLLIGGGVLLVQAGGLLLIGGVVVNWGRGGCC